MSGKKPKPDSITDFIPRIAYAKQGKRDVLVGPVLFQAGPIVTSSLLLSSLLQLVFTSVAAIIATATVRGSMWAMDWITSAVPVDGGNSFSLWALGVIKYSLDVGTIGLFGLYLLSSFTRVSTTVYMNCRKFWEATRAES